MCGHTVANQFVDNNTELAGVLCAHPIWSARNSHQPESCPSCQSCLLSSSSCRFFLVAARQQEQNCHAHCDAAGHLIQNHGIGAVSNV